MRDLRAVESEPHETPVDLGPEPAQLDQQIRVVRREQRMAGIAVMLLDAAKVLEPLVGLLSGHLLRWVALGSAVGLTAFALRQPSWERLATLGVFMVLVPWLIRKGGG